MYFELPYDLSEDLAFLREYCKGRFQPEPNHDRVHIHPIDLSVFDETRNLSSLFKSKDIKLNCAFHFITLPRRRSFIHADGRTPETTRLCALNFPIANCDSTFMNWYGKHSAESQPKDVTSGVPVRYPPNLATVTETWRPTHRLELKGPTIVRTDVWHNIDNSQHDTLREIVSIRFEGNPGFDEMVARLG